MAVEAKQFLAKHRYARISARKARLVADLVRGKPVNRALEILRFNSKRASGMINKVIRSAMANAGQAGDVDVNDLVVAEARIDGGPLAQGRLRYRIQSRQGVVPIHRRTCHIQVILSERPERAGAAKSGEGGHGVKTAAGDRPAAAAKSPAKAAKKSKASSASKPPQPAPEPAPAPAKKPRTKKEES